VIDWTSEFYSGGGGKWGTLGRGGETD